MIRDYQLTIGDICGDRTGLRVKVEDVDIYDRVHFSILESSDPIETEAGDMSYSAFIHRFTRLGQASALRKAA
jgi:hypothetical protein